MSAQLSANVTAPADPGDARFDRVSAAAHRQLMSVFPTGVAVVTTTDVDGTPWGMTCSSLASVTLDPPTILVCLHTGSGTLRALRARGAFGVNLLHGHARHTAELFAAPVTNRFAQVDWQPATRTRAPWLTTDALAFAECRVTGDSIVGDHAVVLGEVVDVVQTPGMPLLYGMRQFAGWLDPRP